MLRKVLGAVLLGAALASPVRAADYFAAPAIAGLGDCSSAANACTLGTVFASAGLAAGDRIFLADGDYTGLGTIAIRGSGVTGTSSLPIEVRGNPSNPNAVVVRGFRIGSAIDYVWYRYLRIAGNLHVSPASSDSAIGIRFAGVRIIGNFLGQNVSRMLLDSSMVYPAQAAGNTFTNNWFALGVSGGECPLDGTYYTSSQAGGAFDTVRACSIYVRQTTDTDTPCSSPHLIKLQGNLGQSMTGTNWLRNMHFTRNRLLIVKNVADAEVRPGHFSGMVQDSLIDNKWVIRDSTSATTQDWQLRVKFTFLHNKIVRDTFYFGGNSGLFMLSSDASGWNRWNQGSSRYDSCFFDMDVDHVPNLGGYGGFNWFSGTNGDSITSSVIKARSSGGEGTGLHWTNAVVGYDRASDGTSTVNDSRTTVIDHNTIWVKGNNNGFNNTSAASFAAPSGSAGGKLKVTNNIFVSLTASPTGNNAAAFYSGTLTSARLTADTNFYFCPITPPSRSINRSGTYSNVGGGVVWCTTYGQDCNSRGGTTATAPSFVDTAYATFNPEILYTSAARFGADGYVGARPWRNFRYVAAGVSAGGSGTTSSTDAANMDRAWPLDTANVRVGAPGYIGTTALIQPGNYVSQSDSINPRYGGNSSARIAFVGTIGNAQACSVVAIRVARPYVTVRYIKAAMNGSIQVLRPPCDATQGGICDSSAAGGSVYVADYDSLANLYLGWGASVFRMRGVQNSVVTACSLLSQYTGVSAMSIGAAYMDNHTESPGRVGQCDAVYGKRIPSIFNSFTDNVVALQNIRPGQHKFRVFQGSQGLTFARNKFLANFDTVAVDFDTTTMASAVRLQFMRPENTSYSSLWYDNRYTVEAEGRGNWKAFVLGDNSDNNTFMRDTIYGSFASAGYDIGMELAYYPNPSCASLELDGNRFNNKNAWRSGRYILSGPVWAREQFVSDTLDTCVVIVNRADSALVIGDGMAASRLWHNTVLGKKKAFRHWGGSIQSSFIHNNIFYDSTYNLAGPLTEIEGPGGVAQYRHDFVQANNSDRNVYWKSGKGTSYADSVIKTDGGQNMTASFFGVGPSSGWFSAKGNDLFSVNGNPVFSTAIMNSTFNGDLGSSSAASGGNFDGGYAGAIGTGAGTQTVAIVANSGGCATASAGTSINNSAALVVSSTRGIFVVIGLEGTGSTAPTITGLPTLAVGNDVRPLTFMRRHSNGKRTNELWFLASPTFSGSPATITLTATFSEAAYYNYIYFAVSGMGLTNPIDDDAFVYGNGATDVAPYAVTVQATKPQSAILSFINGEVDATKLAYHYCSGSGGFNLGTYYAQASPGQTTVSGTMDGAASGGETDWLVSAWEIRP